MKFSLISLSKWSWLTILAQVSFMRVDTNAAESLCCKSGGRRTAVCCKINKNFLLFVFSSIAPKLMHEVDFMTDK